MVAVDKWFPFLERSRTAGTPAVASPTEDMLDAGR